MVTKAQDMFVFYVEAQFDFLCTASDHALVAGSLKQMA